MTIHGTFTEACEDVGRRLHQTSYEVHTEKWQGTDVHTRPEALMREILNVDFIVPLAGCEDLGHWRNDIKPNLPWADDHFIERVCGEPRNPGETWRGWPWALSADKHRTEGEKFTHTYMERYWPSKELSGIRYYYGDLNNVVELLAREPDTRQAYLPIWFPEDTGVLHGGRVPCTLGYHWILRHDFLHTTYYIRSCDYFRHFRDDLYLTVRLTLWLLERLRERDSRWDRARAGMFKFDCVSMHLFINDFRRLFGQA